MPMSSPPLAEPGVDSPQALEESVGYLVRNAHRAYDRVLAMALSKHGILTGQWSLLRVLWHEDNLSQIEVAQRMRVERASLTLLLNAMEKAGLLTRNGDPADRRKQRIRLTAKGRRLQQDLLPLGTAVNTTALVGFANEEVTALRALLQRVINNLEQ